jgi:hypothetical protein
MNLYKRPFPKKPFQDTVIDVLRLNENEWANFKGVASHYLGEKTFHDSIPRKPPQKLLPSALREVRDVDSQNTLAALLHVEHAAHQDPTLEYHKGGGLLETANSIFSTLYNLVGFGPEFDSMFERMGWKAPKKRETPLDRYYAKTVQESYLAPDKRDGQIGGGPNAWLRLPRFDNNKFSVWLDREEKRVHVALKGTSTGADVLSDIRILGTNRSGHEKEIRDYLRDVVRAYGNNYTYDVSAHSLGGAELVNVFQEDEHQLNKYERINIFNPGTTPTHNLDAAKHAVKDPRFHIFLNSGDILSNTYASLINSDSNVAWADASHNPAWNHGMDQWVGDV